MKVHELLIALSQVPIDREVVVAGYGRLAMVTRGGMDTGGETGQSVCVLYVAEPDGVKEEEANQSAASTAGESGDAESARGASAQPATPERSEDPRPLLSVSES